MADINIERKRRPAWPWLLALLLVLAVAVGVWWYLDAGRSLGAGTTPAAEIGTVPDGTPPAYDPATAPQYPVTPPADTTQPDTAG